VKIYGADQTRAFCFCTDGAEGTVNALESDLSDQQAYHIGNNDEITIEALTVAIGSAMGYTGKYENAQTYPGSVSRRCPDISKAQKDFGYKPKISLEEGIRQTVEWYRSFFDAGFEIKTGGFKPPEMLNYRKDIQK